MKNAEVIIIGGGVVGASVAYHLTERGCRDVLILEREDSLGRGSTGKATGGVRAQFETEINIKLSLYSLDFFRDWEFDCEYEPRGYLFLATDEKQFDFLKRTGNKQRSLGYEGVALVDTGTILDIVPGLNCEDIVGGSFGPRDGFINPLAILEGFMTEAVLRGARLKTEINVRSIITKGGRAVGVETSEGVIESEKVVICTGAWTRKLAATAGLDLPVEPLRRQIVWARSENALPPDLPMVIDMSNGFHFRQVLDGDQSASAPTIPAFGHPSSGRRGASGSDLMLAYPDADEKPGFSTEFDDGFIDKVYEKVRHRAPFLAETTVVREKCRAGLYENTPDHHAILGGCEVGGLYFANGFSGHGVMHSPATGRALAEIILDGQASFLDVSSLIIERFAKGELLHETAFL